MIALENTERLHGRSYLEAAGVTVDAEVLDGDLGVGTHRLSAVRADGRQRPAGDAQPR